MIAIWYILWLFWYIFPVLKCSESGNPDANLVEALKTNPAEARQDRVTTQGMCLLWTGF
jgi:hypothetical protein